jgi:hypothetical protein
VSYFLTMALTATIGGADGAELADLARLACLVGDDAPQAPVCRSILELLELDPGLEVGKTLPERFRRLHALVTANVLALTPDVPVA